MSHNAAAVRADTGWARWSAACPCGWRACAEGKEDAEARAIEHNRLEAAREVAVSMTCDCFHPDEAEFYPEYTCPKCRLEQAVGAA